jgi:hypothetical protein
MKIGQGLLLVGLFAVVGYGCGGGASPTGTSLDMCLQIGHWTGSGSCGVTSFDVASTSDTKVTIDEFGQNASVDFTEDSAKTKLTANGLVILAAPNHTCTITCKGTELALHCTNPSGGKCDSTFMSETAVLR